MLGSAALLGNDDGGRFRSPENGLLFLSMLIKVKVFYFQIGVWLRRQNASLPPPCELLASWIPVLSGTSTACIPGSLSQKLPQAVEDRVPTDTQPLSHQGSFGKHLWQQVHTVPAPGMLLVIKKSFCLPSPSESGRDTLQK